MTLNEIKSLVEETQSSIFTKQDVLELLKKVDNPNSRSRGALRKHTAHPLATPARIGSLGLPVYCSE